MDAEIGLSQLTDEVAHIRAVADGADARHEQICETLQQFFEMNQKVWDHHLSFCAQLTEKLVRVERESLEIRTVLLDELRALTAQIKAS